MQFVLFAVVTMVVIIASTNAIARSVAEDEAIAEARNTTEVLARSVVEPALEDAKDRILQGTPRGSDLFLQFARRTLVKALDVQNPLAVRFNMWLEDGYLLYSNQGGIASQSFEIGPDRRRVLREGGTGYEIANPNDPENSGPRGPVYPEVGLAEEDLVRVYTPVEVRGQRLLFEVYYSLNRIQERRGEILLPFRWITIASLAGLLVIVTPILWLLTRRLTRAGEERERLLVHAVDASDAERRRIARDLHDGVVQDIAGTTFSVTALSRDPAVPEQARATLDGAGDNLRDSLRALRSLLAEIHPPDLHADGLEPALGDLVAPATNAGIQASVDVSGVDGASDAAVALVWRVAQEAVRNALRHSQATTVAVTVRSVDSRLRLEVVDDGIGFDPAVSGPDRYGLKGLRSLVKDIGGEIDVISAPGAGTTVRMEVAQQ
ncbi:sensor histidine kinase [Nocardioides abyssi]|uniref:Sensor histidine kinase n=1 Tax=Nocardioides abyssi TaxID=3058370 RepID=A0ABT8EV30_9ACTN|nr:sensor histidine kinase [Nocardioides abyssi]MDN4162030.1 sensor histidine kinase [Nocardioides abyssi]